LAGRSNFVFKSNSLRKNIIGISIFLIWVVIWECISIGVGQELMVPSPVSVIIRLYYLMGTVAFWQITATTVFRITIGFLIGCVLGVGLAVITSVSSLLYAFFKPILNIIKATPVASFIILALIWIRGGQIPAFISFLMVFPIIWANVSKGISQTDRNILEMAKVYHLTRTQIVKKIFVHSVLPYFTAAATISMGLAWKAGIAAEVLSTPQFAIGTSIYDSKIYLETVDLFAWSIVVIAMSVILERLIEFLIKRYLPSRDMEL